VAGAGLQGGRSARHGTCSDTVRIVELPATPATAPVRVRLRAWLDRDRSVLAALALATVVLRLPFVLSPLGIDEGGYAYVASRWIEASGDLYGDQWVDRPPLLLALYALAHLLGDVVGEALALRVLGTAAALVVVLACADTARRVGGSTALRWSGAVAVVLTSSVLLQGHTVNAELPAIACTAGAAWLTVVALQATGRTTVLFAALAGVVAACAVLFKQSFVDGVAFALGAAACTAMIDRRSGRDRAARLVAGGVAGFAAVAAMTAGWAAAAGPGIRAFVDATYAFRLDAGRVLREDPGAAPERAYMLLLLAVASGLLALVAFVLVGSLRVATGSARVERGGDPVVARAVGAGVVAMSAIGLFGVLAGGNYWSHYLLQLVPAVAIGTGLVIAAPAHRSRSRVARQSQLWASVAVTVAVASWVVAAGISSRGDIQRRPATVGDWLAAAAEPGDTAFITWGRANVLERSGMRSPYPMSWSLPIRVRDPELRELEAVLAGSDAPTWIVRWNSLNAWQLDADGSLRRLIAGRYEHVATVCGIRIFRLEAAPVRRAQLPAVPVGDDCTSDSASVAWLLERIG
jgi:hypothetical protein